MSNKQKSVKEQILELKKQIEELKRHKLLEVLREFYIKKGIKHALPNPNSKFESIYTAYLRWQKKYPKELPRFKKLLEE